MKKLIVFLSGLLLLLIMFAALCLSGIIYDTSQKMAIEPYFFQPDEHFAQRPGVPATSYELGEDVVRNMLIERFMTEYFYVIPDINDIMQRMTNKSLLAYMSVADVFQNWLNNVAPTLQKMAEEKKLRLVQVTNVTQAENAQDYWIVEYDLITWDTPNDMSAVPTVTHGQLYIQLIYEKGLRESLREKPIEIALESGIDPVAVFKIKIVAVNSYDVIGQEN